MSKPDLARLDDLRHTVAEILEQMDYRSRQGLYEGGNNAAHKEVRAVMHDQLERMEKVLEEASNG